MRASRILLACLLAGAAVSCGGGSDAKPAEIVLDQPSQIVTLATGKKPGDTKLRVQFTVRFENFFVCGEHGGVMLHADQEAIKTGQYRGVGLIFGRFNNTSHTTRKLPNLQPLAVLETWALGAVSDDFDPLFASSISPQLRDGIDYLTVVESFPSPSGNVISYSMQGDGMSMADTEIDPNPVIDMSLESVAFFNATSAVCPSAIRFTNPIITWSS